MKAARYDLSDDEQILDALRAGLCPICATSFVKDPDDGNCDHEAGWYKEFLKLLVETTSAKVLEGK